MLPDEIISEILSPALKVPDELFSDPSDVSPFATYSPSTSAYLLVCKDWLRVATPLLYHVVVLRSKSQANALEKVLRANPEFGRFIKKLRVEGGYGAAMQTILEAAASTLRDLFLSLGIWSPDSTSGLCKALPRINPHRVIISDPWMHKPLKNKHFEALLNTINSCLRTWDIQAINLPYGNEPYWFRVNRADEFAKSLAQSTSLRIVQISALFDTVPHFIRRLADIPSLQCIDFPTSLRDGARSLIDTVPKLKALARYTNNPKNLHSNSSDLETAPSAIGAEITTSLNPDFVPMSSASEATRKVIWRRVLFFALDVEERRDPAFSPRWNEKYPSRVPILCVSKSFNRLALPYLYDSLRLDSWLKTTSVAQQLQQYDNLGSSIHSIFSADSRVNSGIMITILSRAINLRFFYHKSYSATYALSRDTFKILASTAGASLVELHAGFDFAPSSAVLFQPFAQLRVLAMRTADPPNWPNTTVTSSLSESLAPVLNSLHSLRIDGWSILCLNILKDLSLASLHTLILPPSIDNGNLEPFIEFIKIHGKRLLHLVVPSDTEGFEDTFELCPNLIDLEFHDEYTLAHSLEAPHTSLTKIIATNLPPKTFELDVEMFPSLKHIELRDFKWPTTERGINQSGCVSIAEALLVVGGIKVTDSTGKEWVPRVKSARARKR
ncbi:F-box domain-containing protein [Favolaschia claudopus]|uniref:F-box domain-containing protein n=1 Tax=Favolaschia claudopus TaxID=2862362 RepID=A0AAW0A658_9AGAR